LPQTEQIINDWLDDTVPVVIFFDGDNNIAIAYEHWIDEHVLTFKSEELENLIAIDQEMEYLSGYAMAGSPTQDNS
jgi:hypothetical protein